MRLTAACARRSLRLVTCFWNRSINPNKTLSGCCLCATDAAIMSAIIESGETAIWRRVIRPETAGWTRAGAEAILHLDFQEDDHERMLELLERAKAGELSSDEAAELENYRHVGTTLELMQSRARLSMKSLPAA